MAEISRRSFLRTTALVFGAVVSSGFAAARRAAAAVMPRTTATATIVRGTPGPGGYTKLVDAPGITTWQVRAELGVNGAPNRATCRQGILGFVQFSDIHVVDHQSPLRVEWLDRYEDPSSLPRPNLLTSAYRPHEMLTAQVSDAMVQAVNALEGTPVLDLPVSFVIETGDNSDNSQYNEVRWNVDLLDGGKPVRPDSGDYSKYEGVMKGKDPNYWHPEGEIPTDQAREDHGFPVVHGLLDESRRQFTAEGLNVPWYSVFGNHDGLFQGNFPTVLPLKHIATARLKIMSPPAGLSQANVDSILKKGNLAAVIGQIMATPGAAAKVTPDPNRRILSRKQVVNEYFNSPASPGPVGHGFTDTNRSAGTAYYYVDKGPSVRLIVLDTVNVNGYADGSLDKVQFAWMKNLINNSANKLVLIFSHHTSGTMSNPLVATGGSPTLRVLGDEVVKYLLTKPQVIAWINGHTHRNQIWAHPGPAGGFWEINTASHIDYPQQARIIELADNADDTLSIFTTILDHAGDANVSNPFASTLAMASLSRELAANDWQLVGEGLAGTPGDLNTELIVRKPPGYAGIAAC